MQCRSDIIIISWWSNCLALKCIEALEKFTKKRNIFVVQVGKRPIQKELFRELLSNHVNEIFIPKAIGSDHWDICDYLVNVHFSQSNGIWFWDHDCFLEAEAEEALCILENQFSVHNIALSYPLKSAGEPITNPAFWIYPGLLPQNIPSFRPLPTPQKTFSESPFLIPHNMPFLTQPEKDTMVAIKEFLEDRKLINHFNLVDKRSNQANFPNHIHIGGLNLLTYKNYPHFLSEWVKNLVQKMINFYEDCPLNWVEKEDPDLLKRLVELSEIVPING